MWDIKPFAHGDRCVRVFQGAPHGLEQNLHACAWSKDNRYIGAAGGDRTVVMRSMGPWCNDVRSVLTPAWSPLPIVFVCGRWFGTPTRRGCCTNCRATRAASSAWTSTRRSPSVRTRAAGHAGLRPYPAANCAASVVPASLCTCSGEQQRRQDIVPGRVGRRIEHPNPVDLCISLQRQYTCASVHCWRGAASQRVAQYKVAIINHDNEKTFGQVDTDLSYT